MNGPLVILACVFTLPALMVASLVDWRVALALLLLEGGRFIVRQLRTW